MPLLSFRRGRPHRYGLLRWLVVGLSLVALFSSIEVLSIRSTLVSASSGREIESRQQKIFIASMHWNNEHILRSHWIAAVVALAREFGPENVFVSVQESGSWDDSKGALRLLDQQLAELGIPRKIVLSHLTHADEISKAPGADGWIETPRGKTELRRIPYLARLRNEVIQPLYDTQNSSLRFDKILFLNDVVFQSSDIRELLATNNGEYAAACALDFAKPPAFYDTFALRDSQGHEAVMQEWPYFRSRVSRAAVKKGKPVPVTSCWNGVVAMDAKPFYQEPGLVFRGIPDTLAKLHIEGSECCLIHADIRMADTRGVWLNPNVRVGYSGRAYSTMNPANSVSWISLYSIARGLWINRATRWFTSPWFKEMVINRRVRQWEKDSNSREVGISCLINEMQVLVANGWAHV